MYHSVIKFIASKKELEKGCKYEIRDFQYKVKILSDERLTTFWILRNLKIIVIGCLIYVSFQFILEKKKLNSKI
jgi:hypothetical protein